MRDQHRDAGLQFAVMDGLQHRLKIGAAAAGEDGEIKLHDSFSRQY
jgi:hypothetical protein